MEPHTPREMLTAIKAGTAMSEVLIAKKLNVSQPTVNRILNGQGSCSGSTLMAIFQMYGEFKAGQLPLGPARVSTEQAAA